MWAIDSSRVKWLVAGGWLAFALGNTWLMFLLPGEETIPFHLIWASFALLYGLLPWSAMTTWLTFSAITVATGVPLIEHAAAAIIRWEECSEIVLMGVLVALLIWHVDRHRQARARLAEVGAAERVRAQNREVAARFGSHEVRTRLSIARGFAELIRDATAEETMRADADVVLSELDKASALTTNLLELVRLEAPAALEEIDVPDLVESVTRRWALTTDRVWASSVTIATMAGDAERLEAALDCLIENAVKFTVPGDSISIDARRRDGEFCISVQDSGAGIPAQDLQRVTEIFQTGTSAGERAGGGLGLAIVRAIVEARGGVLEASSIEGTGTRMSMRIPDGASRRHIGAAPAVPVHRPAPAVGSPPSRVTAAAVADRGEIVPQARNAG